MQVQNKPDVRICFATDHSLILFSNEMIVPYASQDVLTTQTAASLQKDLLSGALSQKQSLDTLHFLHL